MDDVLDLLESLSDDSFRAWYQERIYRQNIENGQPYFNRSGHIPEPKRHTPSQILQCHRKITYRKKNAPEEQPDPRGIYWIGSRIEEDLIFPFLSEVATNADRYVQNSIWIDISQQTPAGTVEFKGSTDPVIVDSEGIPVLPTEVKTKDSVDHLTDPNRHHRAQLHTYLTGLSEKFDKEIEDGVIIYVGRKSLDIESFHVRFDEDFWQNTVLDWAATQTKFRSQERLPPSDPEYSWECKVCSFKHRCGEAHTDYRDYPPSGLLPQFKDYPREKVIEYLEAHPDSVLTPTLANEYPDLTEEYEVPDWYCSACESTIDWETVDPDGNPLCPNCAGSDTLSELSLLLNQRSGVSD